MAERRARDDQEFETFKNRRDWQYETRRDWQHGTRDAAEGRRVVVYRAFKYRCGSVARVQVDRPNHPLASWEAGLWLPFLVGPEVCTVSRRFTPVREWAVEVELFLSLLLRAQDTSPSFAAKLVDRACAGRFGGFVYPIFDLDYSLSGPDTRERLLAVLNPAAAS